eukprot:jgi/Mesen1/10086/ME000074S09425
MKSLLKVATKKTQPVDILRTTRDALVTLETTRETKTAEKAYEEATKGISQIKFIFYGDAETYPTQETITKTTKDILAGDFLRVLIKNIHRLDTDSRRDAAQIVASLQRQQVNSRLIACDYLMSNTDLVDLLTRGYEDQNVALFYGSMLRDCIRHQAVARYVLESGDFVKFFDYIELPNFDLASDAAATFRELLTRHKSTVAEFLVSKHDWFFEHYTKLLESPNYITKRMAVKMLADILLDRANVNVMVRYVSSTQNLRIMMNLLKESSKSIQLEAFHIFKVFVANEDKPPEIAQILASNKDKLLRFLTNYNLDKEDKQFEQDKEMVIHGIEAMSLPAE